MLGLPAHKWREVEMTMLDFARELIGRRASRYRVGSRIVTNVDIDIIPWDSEDGVAAGDHGEVIDVDPETGDVSILMDRAIPALVNCRNYLFVRADHLYSRIRFE
jgi:hypothetical protein